MKNLAVVAVLMLSIAAGVPAAQMANAQDLTSPPPNILPPPPPPPPPPKIEIPKVPQMDEIPTSPKAALPRRGSYSDRVTQCIHEGAAAGLGPNERTAYSRACA